MAVLQNQKKLAKNRWEILPYMIFHSQKMAKQFISFDLFIDNVDIRFVNIVLQ